MKKYRVYVSYEQHGHIDIAAENQEQAEELVARGEWENDMLKSNNGEIIVHKSEVIE